MSIESGLSLKEMEFTMSHEQSLSKKMDAKFESNYALAERFASNPQEYLDNLVHLNPEAAEECFNAAELEICCIDGRLGNGNVSIAGSGCLHQKPAETTVFAEKVAQSHGKKLIGLTSHEHCGAAGMKNIDAKVFAKDLSHQTNIPYTRHLDVDLPDFHDEVVVYYSGTASLGLQDMPGLPRGFRLNRRYYPSVESAVFEVEVATQIAFGDHGLGNRFTPEKPLIIVALSDERDSQFTSEILSQELSSIASDRVKIVQVTYKTHVDFQELPLAA